MMTIWRKRRKRRIKRRREPRTNNSESGSRERKSSPSWKTHLQLAFTHHEYSPFSRWPFMIIETRSEVNSSEHSTTIESCIGHTIISFVYYFTVFHSIIQVVHNLICILFLLSVNYIQLSHLRIATPWCIIHWIIVFNL